MHVCQAGATYAAQARSAREKGGEAVARELTSHSTSLAEHDKCGAADCYIVIMVHVDCLKERDWHGCKPA